MFKKAENFGITKSGPNGELPEEMTETGEGFTPTSSPTTCPEVWWSIKGGVSDTACWEEEIEICDEKPADARTKMEGHWLKAAEQLDWSSKWTQGYQWSYESQPVQKKRCIDRGFDEDEKEQCFYEPLNNGCMYD